MLAREQSCRSDNRDLHSAHGGDEGRTQGDLGFPEADIAAYKPVHRLSAGQVRQRVFNCIQLVIGFLVRESSGELFIEPMPCRRGLSLPQRSCCSDIEQFSGHFEDPLLRAGLPGLPADTTKAVNGAVRVLAAVTTDEVDILDRQVNPVASRIRELQAVMRSAGQLKRLQAFIPSDSMVDMHNKVASVERCGL